MPSSVVQFPETCVSVYLIPRMSTSERPLSQPSELSLQENDAALSPVVSFASCALRLLVGSGTSSIGPYFEKGPRSTEFSDKAGCRIDIDV